MADCSDGDTAHKTRFHNVPARTSRARIALKKMPVKKNIHATKTTVERSTHLPS